MKVLILAGGSGTRLWPLSRKNYPKQFLAINGDASLLQQTIQNMLTVVSAEDIVVMTSNEYKFHVQSAFSPFNSNANKKQGFSMILEPEARNTAPAIALALTYCMQHLGCDEMRSYLWLRRTIS